MRIFKMFISIAFSIITFSVLVFRVYSSRKLEISKDKCNFWEWNPSNPILYWINSNQTFHRRKTFYDYMRYVNMLHHRVKWRLENYRINQIIETCCNKSTTFRNNSLFGLISTYFFALISANNHFRSR